MDPFTAHIVDDEPDACRLLQNLLSEYTAIRVQRTFTSGLKALDAVTLKMPDVIFLDIDMPEITGMEFLKQIHTIRPSAKVVFVSAYPEYALEAIQNSAFDFIVKPIAKANLRRVVHKIIASKKNLPQPGSGNHHHLLLKTTEGHHYIKDDDVLFLEAESNYTKIFLKNKETLLSGINLGRLSQKLPKESFVRISRKHIINKNYLKFLDFCKKQCTVSANGKMYKLKVHFKLKEIKAQL